METKIYLVACETNNNYDLMVEATDPEEAILLWREWIRGNHDEDNLSPRFVFQVPEKTGKSRIFKWHASGGMEPVWGSLS
jgi:hypothetical protein